MLIIRLDRLGDVLLTLDVLDAAKKLFVDAKFTMIVHKNLANELSVLLPAIIIKGINVSWYETTPKNWFKQFGEIFKLAKLIKSISPELAIDPRSDARNILAMWLAGVKIKVGFIN